MDVQTALAVTKEVCEQLPTHRQCSITVENKCSAYTLSSPCVYMYSGCYTDPLPPEIEPSSSGSASFTKTAHTARGAVGVFTYDLLNTTTKQSTEKIAVMFSVPYDFNLYSNWYAVGVFDKSRECNCDLSYEMYNNTESTFVRGKASGPGLSFNKDGVTIMATMSDSYQPIIKVHVKDN